MKMKLNPKSLKPKHDFEDRCTVQEYIGPDYCRMNDGSIVRNLTAVMRQHMLKERNGQ